MVLIAPVTAPEDGLVYTTNNIDLKIGQKVIGKGTLFISQSSLSWQPNDLAEGISIMWKQISIHGISSNPSKCIYFMLDHKLVWRGVYEESQHAANGQHNGNGAGDGGMAAPGMAMEQQADGQIDGDVDEGNATDEEDEEEQMTECWLIPEDANTVDTMFQAMTECQALHPDSADSISDESDFMDDDGEDYDGLGPEGNGNDGADAAQGGMRNLNLNDERFADADE